MRNLLNKLTTNTTVRQLTILNDYQTMGSDECFELFELYSHCYSPSLRRSVAEILFNRFSK